MNIDVNAFSDIRSEVRKLCAAFPGEYWRKLDRSPSTCSGCRARIDEGRALKTRELNPP